MVFAGIHFCRASPGIGGTPIAGGLFAMLYLATATIRLPVLLQIIMNVSTWCSRPWLREGQPRGQPAR